MSGGNAARKDIRLRLFGRTDVGQIREHNEDNFLIGDLTRRTRTLLEGDREQAVGEWGSVMGVCDGMGGAAAGEIASQLAVDIIFERLIQGEPPAEHDELARLDVEVHVLENLYVAVALIEIGDLEIRHKALPARYRTIPM